MKPSKISMRKCVASQKMFPKKSLIRIVRTPERQVIIDLTGKKSGRGAYLCAKLDYINFAQKKKVLERALKVSACPEIYEQLREYVKRVPNHE